MKQDSNRLLTPKEVASIIRVSPKTIYRWLHSEELVGQRPGGHGQWRIAKNDLDRFMQRSQSRRLA